MHGVLRDGEEIIDDPVVVMSGEDVMDINVHGGPWVVTSMIELARREGFEIIEEISREMFDAASEIEREMLTNLPLARTREGIAMLLAQPRAWEKVSPRDAERMLADKSLWWMLHPPRVVIVGAPNVGKSTLANQLFAQQRSITADIPGTTRDWVGEIANIDGLAVMLLDTPGVRETTDEIEAAAIKKSREQVEAADFVVRVIEASPPLPPGENGPETELLVLNKSDIAKPPAIAGAIPTVATTGEGVDELRRAIRAHFNCDDLTPHRARWWTQRQRELLQRMMS